MAQRPSEPQCKPWDPGHHPLRVVAPRLPGACRSSCLALADAWSSRRQKNLFSCIFNEIFLAWAILGLVSEASASCGVAPNSLEKCHQCYVNSLEGAGRASLAVGACMYVGTSPSVCNLLPDRLRFGGVHAERPLRHGATGHRGIPRRGWGRANSARVGGARIDRLQVQNTHHVDREPRHEHRRVPL